MFGFSRFTTGSFFTGGFENDNIHDDFEQISRGGSNLRSSSSNIFINEYSCYPVSFAGRDELEGGNKILLPPSALNQLARRNITWPMLFQISNPLKNKFTHSGVLEFIAEEGTCYMPYWMMQNLELQEGDITSIMNTSLSKGTYVKFMPLTMDFLDITNPKAVLETSLRNFATLTVGDVINILYNNQSYKINVLETKPNNAISIIETDIQVDFAPPPDYVDNFSKSESREMTDANMTASVSSEYSMSHSDTIFSGHCERLDGKPIKMNSTTSLHSDKSGQTNASNTESLKIERIPGGVRTRNDKYEELIRSGRIPGIVGVVKK
ncbi:ubiquitin fusion degradation protein with double Psi beta barrel fold [Cryptosporidium canis]|uniref:Ubiquitin fusion degradation protein with double Psi beta barrel fold n=1 Tax=Cryptosporidium canis TaxID=195482 RepID=A0A9D5HXD5_9CRYT|nr:ubiquitin fusion degradation protein with double Psi beta barrel fold [Cryptosporidium canis]